MGEANKEQSASLPRNLSKRPLWVSLSPLFADSPDVVVSRESAPTSTKRPELSPALSSRTLSVTQSPTPTRQAQDRHRSRRRLRSQASRPHPLRLRRMIAIISLELITFV